MNLLRIFVMCLLLIQITISCPDDDLRCQQCAGSICLDCIGGYANNLGNCILPMNTIDNCLYYESAFKCRVCQFKYTPSSQGLCIAILIPNCLVQDLNGRCKICDKKIQAVEGKCESTSVCSIPNCSLCSVFDTVETCELCKTGFTIFADIEDQTSCVVESPLTKNCQKLFYNDLTKCMVCDLNYYINYGTCSPSFLENRFYNFTESTKISNLQILIMALITALSLY
jgi:hypothetical protein